MKVLDQYELIGTDREVRGNGFTSIRFLLKSDEMGFGVHKTIIDEGQYHWHYENHLEACYCIQGRGIITNLETGKAYKIRPGMMYVLDKNDDHTFNALTTVTLISIFNPPCIGNEIHNENGSYDI